MTIGPPDEAMPKHVLGRHGHDSNHNSDFTIEDTDGDDIDLIRLSLYYEMNSPSFLLFQN